MIIPIVVKTLQTEEIRDGCRFKNKRQQNNVKKFHH